MIYSAFGEGSEFRSMDVSRAYATLGFSADAPNSTILSNSLAKDAKRGFLEKLETGVWRVLQTELDVASLVQGIDVDKFVALDTHAARIRMIYAAFGEGRVFRSSDVTRAYKTLAPGLDVPNSTLLSTHLVEDTDRCALESIGYGVWRVLHTEVGAKTLDVASLVQSIDVERFVSLPTLFARCREICAAFGEGTEFRLDDILRAHEVLGGVDVPSRASVSSWLQRDSMQGQLEKVWIGVWRVLQTELDVASLVQGIDVERFVSLPTQAARIHAVYSAFGEGAKFRASDVVRAYRALDAGIDAPYFATVTSQLANDVKMGLLAKLERGLWQVLSAPVEPPGLDVASLVQSIDIKQFSELPTHAARIRAIYSVFGDGTEFRASDVVRAYRALDAGTDASYSVTVTTQLANDVKMGLLAKLERGLWQVLNAPVEPPALDVAPLVQSIDIKQFSELPSHAARTRAIHSAFGEGTEFRPSDVVRAYEALDAGVDAPSSKTVSSQLIQDTKMGLLTKLERGLWQVLSAPVEPPGLDVAPLIQSIDVERFSKLPTEAARIRMIHSAFGVGTEFRASDVVRAYEALDSGVEVPDAMTVSACLRKGVRTGLLVKLEPGLWQVLSAPVEPLAIDVASLVQGIDAGEFASLRTQAARIRVVCSAFGEGTVFRPSDVVQAFQLLNAGIDTPSSSNISTRLRADMMTGLLAKPGRGLWQVLSAADEPPGLDVAPLIQSIDVERFSKLPTEAARIRMIHSAFGVGTEFRASDVVRAYEALDAGVDAPGSMTIESCLYTDTKTGKLAKIKRGLWCVLRAPVELLTLDVVSLPTQAARIHAVYSAFGEGAKFRASDVVSVLNRSGVVAPTVASIQRVLEEDVEAGKLERIESGLWKVVDANRCDDTAPSESSEEAETQQPKRPGVRSRASQEPLERSVGVVDNEPLGVRVERLCEALGEHGRVFDSRDVEQAFEREGTPVSLVMRTKLFVKLDALLTRGFLEAVDREDWGTFRLATP